MLNLMVPYMGHKKSAKVAHIFKAYGTIKQITIGQQNANRNATHLTYIFKVQRDGIAKVSKFPLLIWRQPTHQILSMDKTPSI